MKKPNLVDGNQFWKLRSSHGVAPKFKSGDELWSACCEYFQWAQSNPLQEQKAIVVAGRLRKVNINKMRAMTLIALQLFIDISHDTWGRYRKRKGLSEVTRRVDGIIRSQKFEGAAAGLLNANIIARDLGLQEQIASEQSGPDKGPITHKWVIEVKDPTPSQEKKHGN